LETFYSTGIRRMELVNLKLFQVDHLRGTVSIWQGKGKKDRVVPIGERALLWLDKYLREARPQLVMEPDEGSIFLTVEGGPFSLDGMSKLVRVYVEQANLGKSGACHMLRHTMATLMLENGADIRYIQEMLGHSKLESTQIYTQVSIRQLKKIHSATHPGAMLEKKRPVSTNTATQDEGSLRANLLATLDAEAEEESEQNERGARRRQKAASVEWSAGRLAGFEAASDNELVIGCAARSVLRAPRSTNVLYLYSEVVMLAIRLPQSIEKRLERLARLTCRTKTYYGRE